MHQIILKHLKGSANSACNRKNLKSYNGELNLEEPTDVIQAEKKGKGKVFQVEQELCAKAQRCVSPQSTLGTRGSLTWPK